MMLEDMVQSVAFGKKYPYTGVTKVKEVPKFAPVTVKTKENEFLRRKREKSLEDL